MSAVGTRMPVVAGQFYDGSQNGLARDVKRCLGDYAPPQDLRPLVGGVVPHAGWVFSGPTAAKVFAALSRAKPQTYVLFGAVHQWGSDVAAVYPRGSWETPLGKVQVDEALGAAIVEAGAGSIESSAEAHDGEHSIEVQVPFIHALSPGAKIIPIAVPPVSDAVRVGEIVAGVIKDLKADAVVVASTDLTHYGMGYGLADRGPLSRAMPWMRANDQRIIRLIESLSAEEVVPEAARSHNACGPGAVAAAVAAARKLGAGSARVLEYTTSADVMPDPDESRAVGYVGMVFERNTVEK